MMPFSPLLNSSRTLLTVGEGRRVASNVSAAWYSETNGTDFC